MTVWGATLEPRPTAERWVRLVVGDHRRSVGEPLLSLASNKISSRNLQSVRDLCIGCSVEANFASSSSFRTRRVSSLSLRFCMFRQIFALERPLSDLGRACPLNCYLDMRTME